MVVCNHKLTFFVEIFNRCTLIFRLNSLIGVDFEQFSC